MIVVAAVAGAVRSGTATAWSELAGRDPLAVARDLASEAFVLGLLGAMVVGLAGALLALRGGAAVAGAVTTAAVVTLSLSWIGGPGSATALGAHVLVIAALLLTVGVRTTAPVAALGLAAALLAGLLEPGAWLLAPAVPAAALAGNEARQRRFVLSALVAVVLLALLVGVMSWWASTWSPPWPPTVQWRVATVLALPGLLATLVATFAAVLSALARSRRTAASAQAPDHESGPTKASLRRVVGVTLVTVVITGTAAAAGGLAGTLSGTSQRIDQAGTGAAGPGAAGPGAAGPGAVGTTTPGTTSPGATPPPASEAGPPGAFTTPTPAQPCPTAVPPAAPATLPDADSALLQAAAELRRNQNITLCAAGAAALDAGQVDGRLIAVLALLADGHRFRVHHLVGADAGLVVLESPNGIEAPAADSAVWLRAQRGPYAPTAVTVIGRDELWISYAAIPPETVETPIA